jgi:hypothetical protein
MPTDAAVPTLVLSLSKDEPFLLVVRQACPERSAFDRLRPSVEGLTTSGMTRNRGGPGDWRRENSEELRRERIPRISCV